MTPEALAQKLINHGDARIRDLAEGEPNPTEMGILLAPHVQANDAFSIRYLAPGRSGSKVLLIVYANGLPTVVKFGPRADIEREKLNYAKSEVRRTLSSDVRPDLDDHIVQTDLYASIQYSWAGNWDTVQTLRKALPESKTSSLKTLLQFLIGNVFKWHQPRRSPTLPFDQWTWTPSDLASIKTRIESVSQGLDRKQVQRLIVTMEDQSAWRDSLKTKTCSEGICHGDMNFNNILVKDNALSHTPKLIDFASVRYADSPARDWAKVEREIKLRFLRDSFKVPREFKKALEVVDNLVGDNREAVDLDERIKKAVVLGLTVRRQYYDQVSAYSDIPQVEYLYYLLCWTLGYLNNVDCTTDHKVVQQAIVESALRTFALLDNHIRVVPVQGLSPRKKQKYLRIDTPALRSRVARPSTLPIRFDRLDRAEFFVGRQSHINALDKFWRTSEQGALSLVGLGGAGKTTIVRHFLETEGWLGTKRVPRQPDALFVWSFYDRPNSTEFIAEAYRYFLPLDEHRGIGRDVTEAKAANVFQLAELLANTTGRLLIVMDGLEKVQSQRGATGPRGTLVDPPLRNFLTRVVDGACGRTKVIITSRFPLTDLVEWRGSRYHELDVDDLGKRSAQTLLRKLGVHGGTVAMNMLVKEYGLHALTLDLLGRLLVEYCNGDPARSRELPPLELAVGSGSVDKQVERLTRVLRAYEVRLDAVELDVLQYLSVFRRPVSFSLLKDVVVHVNQKLGRTERNRPEERDLKTCLHALVDRRLVNLETTESEEFYSVHPAIKDHFYIRLTDTVLLHDAVRQQLATLVDIPGTVKPKDTKILDLIEEFLYHSIEAKRESDAYAVYSSKLGYRHLGWELGDHVRGLEISRLFDDAGRKSVGPPDPTQHALLTIDHGLYLKNLGLLDDAIRVFRSVVDPIATIDHPLQAAALQNLSATQIMRGLLVEAETSARAAAAVAATTGEERLIQDCHVRIGTACALQGLVQEAERVFRGVTKLFTEGRTRSFPRDLPEIRYSWLLLRLGRLGEAEKELVPARELSESLGFRIITARLDLMIAELAFRRGEVNDAVRSLDQVYNWASQAYDQEMVVAADVLSASIALSVRDLDGASRRLRDGLRVAEEGGYGIYWIDLKVLEGHMHLVANDFQRAYELGKHGLEGHRNRGERPNLLGASSKGCAYRWGEADALQLIGQAQAGMGDRAKALKTLDAVIAIRRSLSDPRTDEAERLREEVGGVS